jgi:hypothetical protein
LGISKRAEKGIDPLWGDDDNYSHFLDSTDGKDEQKYIPNNKYKRGAGLQENN